MSSVLLRQALAAGIVLADGAMGTYFAEQTGSGNLPEWANLSQPAVVRRVHQDYVDAGSQLLRANTFSANTITLGCTRAELKQVVQSGWQLAAEAVGPRGFAAADIGPIPEMKGDHSEVSETELRAEYSYLVDCFLEAGANIFIFETLSSIEPLPSIWQYIKQQCPQAFILAQFALTPEGTTRRGLRLETLNNRLLAEPNLDAFGYNCGVGPAHMLQLLQSLETSTVTTKPVSALPNASYPAVIHERTMFQANPQYFADRMADMVGVGARIIGGCCGTTPAYIEAIRLRLQQTHVYQRSAPARKRRRVVLATEQINPLAAAFALNRQPVAVELDPPFTSKIDKILGAAEVLKEAGVDLITIADSPLARARMDAAALAGIVQREVGIPVMPHFCCRDRNVIALKSSLLAAHAQGIRTILAVTGDPVGSGDRGETKPVFNVNSVRLMELIQNLNQDVFAGDPFYVGGALQVEVPLLDHCLTRTQRKMEQGAGFFLSQPIFTAEAAERLGQVRRRCGTKILGGIMPLVSLRNAQFINHEIPGIDIPQELVDRFSATMDRQAGAAVGIELAAQLTVMMRPFVDGYYFIAPFNRAEMIVDILARSGIGGERSQEVSGAVPQDGGVQ